MSASARKHNKVLRFFESVDQEKITANVALPVITPFARQFMISPLRRKKSIIRYD